MDLLHLHVVLLLHSPQCKRRFLKPFSKYTLHVPPNYFHINDEFQNMQYRHLNTHFTRQSFPWLLPSPAPSVSSRFAWLSSWSTLCSRWSSVTKSNHHWKRILWGVSNAFSAGQSLEKVKYVSAGDREDFLTLCVYFSHVVFYLFLNVHIYWW